MQSHWELQESTEYRLLKRGTMAISDRELLQSLVGSAKAATQLTEAFGNLRTMAQADFQEFMQLEGVDRLAALRLVAAFELGRRKSFDDTESVRLNTAESVSEYVSPKFADLVREVFVIMYLSQNHELIAEEQLFSGGVSSVVVDPRLIFKKAVLHLASGIILVHNHPSGSLIPSQADRSITQKLKDAGEVLDIPVLDHVIVSRKGYYSFATEGQL